MKIRRKSLKVAILSKISLASAERSLGLGLYIDFGRTYRSLFLNKMVFVGSS